MGKKEIYRGAFETRDVMSELNPYGPLTYGQADKSSRAQAAQNALDAWREGVQKSSGGDPARVYHLPVSTPQVAGGGSRGSEIPADGTGGVKNIDYIFDDTPR